MDGARTAELLRELLPIVKGRSALYERLLAGFAGAAERAFDGGALGRLLTVDGEERATEVRTLLLAALHHAALADPSLPHASWYATAVDAPMKADEGAPAALALAYLVEHEAEVAGFLHEHRLQTNEIGRCANLLPGFLAAAGLGLPLTLVELGTSAGLNLRFDRYRYRYQDGPSWGPSGGPVLTSRAEGDAPSSLAPPTVDIQARIGVDLAPIDATSDDGARLLTAFVWPDEWDRHERLRGALTVAASTPVRLVTDDLVTYAESSLAPTDGTTTVVFHSVVRHLLTSEQHGRLSDAVDRVLRRATEAAPVVHVAFEGDGSDLTRTPEVTIAIATGDGGTRRRVLAQADWHGRWVRWVPWS